MRGMRGLVVASLVAILAIVAGGCGTSNSDTGSSSTTSSTARQLSRRRQSDGHAGHQRSAERPKIAAQVPATSSQAER